MALRTKPVFIDLTDEATGKEVWVVGDLHGQWYLLEVFLEMIGFDPAKHLIISVGDQIDRGTENNKVWQWFKKHGKSVIGNHEWMWLDLVEYVRDMPYDENGYIHPQFVKFGRDPEESFTKNGMKVTLHEMAKSGVPAQEWFDYMRSLPTGIVIGDHLIVHGGMDPKTIGKIEDHTEEDIVWMRKPYLWADVIAPELRMGKRLITGHTITSQKEIGAMPGEVVVREDRILLDIGAADHLGLAAYCINSGEFYRVEGPNLKHALEALSA